MGTTSEKLTYLNDTKQLLKENINNLGGNLTTEPFRQYASVLEGIYERIPKVSGIGSSLSLSPTMVGRIKLNEIQGDTLQNGTPTPNTPVEIQNVTGLQNIEVCGKNLYNPSYRNENNQIDFVRCTGSEANGIYTMTATNRDMYFWYVVSSGNSYTSASGPLFEFTEDTYSMTITNSLFTNNYVTYYDENKISLGYVSKSSNQFTINKNDKTGAKYFSIRIGYGQATVGETYETSIQLEQGSTTEYEPYKDNTYEINLGKNLIYTSPKTDLGIEFTYNSNTGETSISGTASSTYAVAQNIQCNLPPGTYTLSIQNTYNFSIGIGIYINGTRTPKPITSGNKSLTFTTNGTITQYDIYITSLTTGENYSATFKLQLEKGSVATSFSPYFTPIELNKIGDYKDKIYKDDGKWYLEKNIGKIVLDGSESDYGMYTDGVKIITMPLISESMTYGDGFSNYFSITNSYASLKSRVGNFAFPNNGTSLQFSTNEESVTNFKNWLSTHNTEVYYILKTSTITEITNTELIEDLETLYTAKSQEGTTNISITSEDLEMILNVSALKKEE